MKKILLASCAALSICSSAFAADLPARTTAAVPAPVASNNWSGFYVGALAGVSNGTHEHYMAVGKYGDGSISGGLFGGTVGYNHQISSVVLGIEADWAHSTASDTFAGNVNGCMQEAAVNSGGLIAGGYCRTDVKWMSTVRGRVGYSFGQFMTFVTGGWAMADITAIRPYDVSITSNYQSTSKTRSGYALGAGVEYALTKNISAKVDYLYADFGKKVHYYGYTGALDHPLAYNTHVVRLGLNYKFGM